jgi:PIN domain nuclease of toxin-antitoxin system
LWAIYAPHRLSRRAAAVMEDTGNVLVVSAVSAWEIATKVRLGRLPEAQELERDFIVLLNRGGYNLRSVTVEDGLRAGRLVGEHQDPFDRMIAAQALADDIPVIGLDAKLDQFGVRRIW